jgi:hypothetical protein
MKRLLGCLLLLGAGLTAQVPSMESIFLALKDPHADRRLLSVKLAAEITHLSKSDHGGTVERFSADVTTALLGKNITTDRAAALQKEMADVLSGKGSTFLPAARFRETLLSCGVDDRNTQVVVDRFTHLGREVRGPDDVPVRKFQ